MKRILPIILIVSLAGCNSMYIKPNTLDKNKTVWAYSGGYSMRRAIKERMEERGYKVVIGKNSSIAEVEFANLDDFGELNRSNTLNARYLVKVKERQETFWLAGWCMFNGFWWWDFNVSIGDQKTGEEIFSWVGKGCANSSLRKLDDALDQLEIK